ncbi:hypothetical protein V8E51_011314 [Hyaloscypha variabilis]
MAELIWRAWEQEYASSASLFGSGKRDESRRRRGPGYAVLLGHVEAAPELGVRGREIRNIAITVIANLARSCDRPQRMLLFLPRISLPVRSTGPARSPAQHADQHRRPPRPRIPPNLRPPGPSEREDSQSSSGVARRLRFLKAATASLFCGIGHRRRGLHIHHNVFFALHTSHPHPHLTPHFTSPHNSHHIVTSPSPIFFLLSPAAASRTLHTIWPRQN